MNKTQLTLGSLFDGSGGFPLGGLLSGITPVWASEIEPFPIRVTTKRLPKMKHYGDVSGLNGADLEPVDIITFGSPCQDMSLAGKRSGLEGERSVLFYEAIRIIKEMREKTNGEKPRWIVWENVPGAFSSNKGEDFRAVLEAVIRIKEPDATMPPADQGRWPYADTYVGDGWSVAYRTLDAQYLGVPQRRRRIYLVADFAGEGVGKVLFESEGVSGYTPQGFRTWKGTAGGAEESSGETGGHGLTAGGNNVDATICASYGTKWNGNAGALNGDNFVAEKADCVVLNDQGGSRMDVTEDVACTLRAEAHHPPVVMDGELSAAGFCTEHSKDARGIGYQEECSPTLRAGVVPAAVALENHPNDSRIKVEEDGKVQTLSGRMGTGGGNVPLLMEQENTPVTLKIRSGCEGGGKGILCQQDKSATLGCNNDQTVFVPESPASCYWDGGQKAGTLTDKNARGVQRMPDKQNFNCVLEAEEDSTGESQQAFGISSYCSHAMLSDNPHAGIYEAKTSRTLDCCGGSPVQNQGGICIVGKEEPVAFTQNQRNEVRELGDKSGALAAEPGMKQQTYVLEGNGSRPSHKGDGYAQSDKMYTLNTVETHAVAAPEDGVYSITTGSYMETIREKSPTLMARDYKDPTSVAPVPKESSVNTEPIYTVRRLTPTECARLQGFPDDWCQNLGTENPTDEEMAFWTEVFETHRRLVTHSSKPKTEKQIRKWLADPYSDSAEYKLWGNGVALPCVYFVLSGIVWADSL